MIESPRFTDRAYARMLLNLFPQGSAFPRDEKNSLFYLLLGLAQELFRLDGRANKLVKESEPGEAEELIGDHETDLGVPGSCFGVPSILSDRRQLAEWLTIFPLNLETGFHRYATITAGSDIINISGNTDALLVGDSLLISSGFTGGKYKVLESLGSGDFRLEQTTERSAADIQVKAYFTKAEQSERFYNRLASFLGYEITGFEYFESFEMGEDGMGDEIGDAWRFAVKIKYHRTMATNDDLLPCLFEKLKPAHVHFIFEIDS